MGSNIVLSKGNTLCIKHHHHPNPPKPGTVLKNLYMKPSKLSTANLVKQLNVSSKTIADIVHNRSRITLDLAVKLSTVFEPKPDFWLNIQSNYDLW